MLLKICAIICVYVHFLEEAETLGVHELPRSSSSLSMRTDASGHGEHASSDSFYDSDNTEAEAAPASQIATKAALVEGGNCIKTNPQNNRGKWGKLDRVLN